MKYLSFNVVLLLAVIILGMPACAVETSPQNAVLVTGASSGIGRNIAERLARNGYFVYATARKDKDLEALNAIENIEAIRLDVTDQDQIDAAVSTVKAGGRGLYGLVNNAGVAAVGSMMDTTQGDLDFQFGVNVFGVHRVTKAFMPMIVESQGRITTIGSISGFIAGDNAGAYSMTKFAMEAFTDSLAAEMGPQGVTVNIVEPGSFKSKIWRKMADRRLQQARQASGEVSEDVKESLEGIASFGAGQPEPDAVAAAVEHALFSESPKRRYMVTPDQEQAEATIREALRRVAELNHDHEYSYSREQLTEMLDQALDAL
jgi:NAD(P)-dependent dehydrogenase (short-subunit alcohol dehydrogenase family)